MRTAVIPAGGTGRRMLPLTATIPKPLLPVGMRATLHYIVEECVLSGVERVGIVTKYRADDIRDYFLLNDFPEFDGLEIEFIPQGDGWGMSDAVSTAEEFTAGEPFAVLLADDIIRSKTPALTQMMEAFEGGHVVGCERVPPEDVHRYGAVVPEAVERGCFDAVRIVEKPKEYIGTNLVIAGRYILGPCIFDALESVEDRSVSVTDIIGEEICKGTRVRGRVLDGTRHDVGKPDGYLKAFVTAVQEGW